MKKLTKLQMKRVEQYEQTLNKNSKFYNSDLQDFISNVRDESPEQSEISLKRVGYLSSDAGLKHVEQLINKMEKEGMFNVKKMGALNSLD